MYRQEILEEPREFVSAYLRELRPGMYELAGTGTQTYLGTMQEGPNVRPMRNTETWSDPLGDGWHGVHKFHPGYGGLRPLMDFEFRHGQSASSVIRNDPIMESMRPPTGNI